MKILVGYRGPNVGKDLLAPATKHANAFDGEVIILGVKSRFKVGKILFGSTAQYVILKSQCPVISVK